MRIFIIILFIMLGFTSWASEMLLEQTQEKRAKVLFENIRCPSCEGQSIKDSGASIAKMLRENVRKQIINGKSDQEIINNLKSSYGESIMFMPENDLATLALWLAPLLILLLFTGKFLVRLLPIKSTKL